MYGGGEREGSFEVASRTPRRVNGVAPKLGERRWRTRETGCCEIVLPLPARSESDAPNFTPQVSRCCWSCFLRGEVFNPGSLRRRPSASPIPRLLFHPKILPRCMTFKVNPDPTPPRLLRDSRNCSECQRSSKA